MTSLHADEAFLGHYQLSHDPFAPRVPGFKFFPAQRKPVLGQLHHLARYSQLLLVVTGPLGSGKTLLRQALVASTNKQTVQSVVVSARSASDASSMLAQVAQELGVAVLDEAQRVLQPSPALHAALDGLRWLASHAQGQGMVVSIDLADLRGYAYYTGMRFALFALTTEGGSGQALELARGGRYDEVGAVFGRNRPAVGFSLDL